MVANYPFAWYGAISRTTRGVSAWVLKAWDRHFYLVKASLATANEPYLGAAASDKVVTKALPSEA